MLRPLEQQRTSGGRARNTAFPTPGDTRRTDKYSLRRRNAEFAPPASSARAIFMLELQEKARASTTAQCQIPFDPRPRSLQARRSFPPARQPACRRIAGVFLPSGPASVPAGDRAGRAGRPKTYAVDCSNSRARGDALHRSEIEYALTRCHSLDCTAQVEVGGVLQ